MFDRPKNIFQLKRRDEALDTLKEVYPEHFLGDTMFVAGRSVSFLEEPAFQKAMEANVLGEPYAGMMWRMHTLIWAIEQTMEIKGAIAEFGTFRGFKFKFILDYFGDKLVDKDVYLFDTFDGIDTEQNEGSPISVEEHRKVGLFAFVSERFKAYKNVNIIKGAAPNSLDQVDIGAFSMVHIDMNSWQAELGTIERLWDKMPAGAILVLDDYGFSAHRAQLDKEKPWFADKGCPVLELPTGQGLVIKNV